MEVVLVDLDEKLVHQPVGPEAVHLQGHQVGAVCQVSVESTGCGQKKKTRNNKGRQTTERMSNWIKEFTSDD